MKKISCLYITFENSVNGYNYCQIFIKNDVKYILVEFESDRMSQRETAKNERIGAYGLKCNFFNFKLGFEIYDKNYSRKKFHVYTTLQKSLQ